uniref:Poly(A) RNA polymerase GLD2 (inferred by orthology to a human protein) n=1 Tax=Strongyloides venezuelensis TaxID=75913 RepID=A0A0K0FG50_STRVS
MYYFTRNNNFYSNFNIVIQRFLQRNVHFNKKKNSNSGKSVYEIVTLSHNDKLKNLENKLEILEKQRAETHSMISKKVTSKINKLKDWICDEKSDIVIIGSVATGLTLSSDTYTDLVVVSLDEGSNGFLSQIEENELLLKNHSQIMGKHITENPFLWDNNKDKMYNYTKLSVPLLDLRFGDSTNLSIRFYDYNSLKRTNLVRYYAASDPRFRKLYMYVKMLLPKIIKDDSANEPLKGYSISLLVAHFLQTSLKNEQPVLPLITEIYPSLLSPHLSTNEVLTNLKKPVDVSAIQSLINPKPLASHLVVQFIEYFADFDFTKNAIYVNKVYPKVNNKNVTNSKLQIFDLYSDMSIDNSDRNLKIFSKSMQYARDLVKRGYLIDDIPNFDKEKIPRLSFRSKK